MRVAAIYDIHGNLPALEAVLQEIHEEGVDAIVVGGDVLPGPMPRACLEALRALVVPVHYLYGNGERDILALHRGEGLHRVPPRFHDVMRWVASELSPDDMADLARWPLSVTLAIPGMGDVLFCHATPRDENALVTRDTPDPRFQAIFGSCRASVVVCGHTHMQFQRPAGAVRVVNAGSVGLPFGEPGAYWAVLGPDIELRRTEYDRTAAAAAFASTGYPRADEFQILAPPPERHMIDLFEAAATQG